MLSFIVCILFGDKIITTTRLLTVYINFSVSVSVYSKQIFHSFPILPAASTSLKVNP